MGYLSYVGQRGAVATLFTVPLLSEISHTTFVATRDQLLKGRPTLDAALCMIADRAEALSPARPTSRPAAEATAPSVMPITFRFNGKNHDRRVSADSHPFGLRRNIDGKQSYIFLSGPETDCATEPIETENFTNERTSIQGKLMAYLAIIEQRTFASQFGFTNFFVPFLRPDQSPHGSECGNASMAGSWICRLWCGRGVRRFRWRGWRAD